MTTFTSRAQVFGWLVELERLDAPPDRQGALRNGWELVQLAIREDRLASEQADTLARFIAELEEDRWIGWDYQAWPSDTDAPSSRGFTTQHLQRCDRIRITPEGYAAWAARPDTALAVRVKPAPAGEPTHDVFLCHAGEDKDEVARPLAEALFARGYEVWFDEFELAIGDSLRRSIDEGLATCRFGLVVLSPSFFSKGWPQRELDGLTARETGSDLVILPIWHQVDEEEVRRFSPPLADRLAASSEEGTDALAERVVHAINRSRGLARSLQEGVAGSPLQGAVAQRIRDARELQARLRGIASQPVARGLEDAVSTWARETAEFLQAEADEFADEFADDGTYADETLMDYLTRRIDALEGFLERLRGVRRFRNNNAHLVAPPVPRSDEHPDGLFKVGAGQEVETTDPAVAADLAALPNVIEVQRPTSSR